MADSQIQRDPKIQERMDQVQDVTDIMAKNVENSNISNFNNPIRHVHHKTILRQRGLGCLNPEVSRNGLLK